MGVLEPDLKPEVSLFSSETLPIFVELEDFVKFFLHKWVFPSNMIAFVVRLLPKWIGRRYKAKNPLLDYVAERLVKTYEFPCRKAFAYDYLKKKLSGESLLLLLDGLDKALTSQSPKKMQEVGNRVVAVIKDLSSENSPIIVTAHECVDSRLLGFQYLWVENLTQRDRHTFVEN